MAKVDENVLSMTTNPRNISNDRSRPLQNSARQQELSCVQIIETFVCIIYHLDFGNEDVKHSVYPTLLPHLCSLLNEKSVVEWIFIELSSKNLIDVTVLEEMWNDRSISIQDKIRNLLWSVLGWEQQKILDFLTFLCNLKNIPLSARSVRRIINRSFEGSVKGTSTGMNMKNRQYSSSESGFRSYYYFRTICAAISSTVTVKRVVLCVIVCIVAISSYEVIKHVSNNWNADTSSDIYGIAYNNPNSSLISQGDKNEQIDPSQNSMVIGKTEIRRDDKFYYNFSRLPH